MPAIGPNLEAGEPTIDNRKVLGSPMSASLNVRLLENRAR